jgi:hypothetical protein
MSNFYRLSITEMAATLEVVVELPDHLYEGKSEDAIRQILNGVATAAVRQRYLEVHNELPENFPSLFQFEIEPSPDFDPSGISLATYRYQTQSGVRVWITRPTSMLVY